MHIAAVPLAVMSLLFMLVPGLTGSTSFMIIPSGAMAIAITWVLYRRERKSSEK